MTRSIFDAQQQAPSRRTLWKILPAAALIFIGIVLLILFLGRSGGPAPVDVSGILHPGDPYYEWYRKYVELKDPRIQMGQNMAGGRVMTFHGVVENGGEKTLDIVEITVSLFNYEEPVWETKRLALKPGPFARPVAPLNSQPFDFYISVEDVPEEWIASHAEMSISGFRFLK